VVPGRNTPLPPLNGLKMVELHSFLPLAQFDLGCLKQASDQDLENVFQPWDHYEGDRRSESDLPYVLHRRHIDLIYHPQESHNIIHKNHLIVRGRGSHCHWALRVHARHHTICENNNQGKGKGKCQEAEEIIFYKKLLLVF
jgi:hypothetical protein